MPEGKTVVLSCKVPASVGIIIDRVRREHPEIFPDKSSVIRAAVLRMLKDIECPDASSRGIPTVHEQKAVDPIDELINSLFEEDGRK